MEVRIKDIVKANQETIKSLLSNDSRKVIEKAAKGIIRALEAGGKVIVFGNGGSAADSQHMVAELVGRFKKERQPIPAIALTTNTSILTALSNDYGYNISFKRQLEALGKKNDFAIGISTSGMAKNVIEALKQAKRMGLATLALTGRDGGRVKDIADIAMIVKSDDTPRIQEAHILIVHILCELIEESVAKSKRDG